MTSESVPTADSPRELLSTVRTLTRRVRLAQRGAWFPLLVFAAITLAAIPIYRFAPRHLGACRSGPHGTTFCAASIRLAIVYWPIALTVAYVMIAGFYVNRSRQRGVGTRIRPYVVVGIVIAVLLAAVSTWRASHPLLPSSTRVFGTSVNPSFYDLASPAAAIGLALLVLAWIERSLALLIYTLVYLVIVVVNASRMVHSTSQWYFLPNLLLPATLLLLGSGLFAFIRPKTGSLPR